jgi:hypothetical protein
VTITWRTDAPANLVKLTVGECLVEEMDAGKWTKLGLLTDTKDRIEGHGRLLRSLYFGDDDYESCVLDMVPVVLGEVPDPVPDPWAGPLAPPALEPAPLSLFERFPHLVTVTEFLDLPAWLAPRNPQMFQRLFLAASSATMPDGTVLSQAEAAAARLEVDEMRRQVERIRRDHATDPEAAVGQAKELIETACKTILGLTGEVPGGKEDLPKLVTRTLRHLGLDPSQLEESAADVVELRAAKRVLGGVAAVLNGAGELRNARGTGHGRSGSPLIDASLARLTAGLVLPTVIYLIEAYEVRTGATEQPAPALPLPSTEPGTLVGRPQLQLGVIVRHDNYGEGQIVAVDGDDEQLVATVDFGGMVGQKKMLVRYAGLQSVSGPAEPNF